MYVVIGKKNNVRTWLKAEDWVTADAIYNTEPDAEIYISINRYNQAMQRIEELEHKLSEIKTICERR